MKYSSKKILSLFLSIIIGITSIQTKAFAVNEQIPALLLSSEQYFLEKLQDRATNNSLFQMNKKDVWKTIPNANGWEIIKKNFAYGNLTVGIKKEDIRFVIQPRKNNSNELTVVVYRKVRGEWVPRYGSDASGENYVTERLDTKGNIIAKDITPANVEEKLIKAHIAYSDDRFEKIKTIRQHFLTKLPKKDVYQRQLAEQIFGTTDTNVKPAGPLQTVLKDWIDVPSLDKSTAEFVAAGAIQSMMNLHRKFEGKSTAQNWRNYFATTDNGIKQETIDSKTFQKIKELVIHNTPEPKSYSDYVTSIKKELEPFNARIRNVQAICTLKQVDHTTEQTKLGKAPTINDQSSAEDLNKYADYTSQSLQITNAQAELAKNGAAPHLEYITHESPLAMFVWTAENTQHELGEFTPDGCIHNGAKVDLHEISLSSATWAYQKFDEMLIETINQSIDLIESPVGKYNYDNELTKYIRSSPLAVKNALGTRKVIDEVTYVGQRVREIYSQDKFNRNLDYTIMAAAFAGGIASGFGAGGMVYLMGATDAVAFLRGGSQWYNNYFLEPIQRQAIAANQIDRDQGLKSVKQSESEQMAGLTTAIMTGAGNAVGFGIGKMIKPATKSTNAIADIEQGSKNVVINQSGKTVVNSTVDAENNVDNVVSIKNDEVPVTSLAAGKVDKIKTISLRSGVDKQFNWTVILDETVATDVNGINNTFYSVEVRTAGGNLKIKSNALAVVESSSNSKNLDVIVLDSPTNTYYHITYMDEGVVLAPITRLSDERFSFLKQEGQYWTLIFDHQTKQAIRYIPTNDIYGYGLVLTSDGSAFRNQDYLFNQNHLSKYGGTAHTFQQQNFVGEMLGNVEKLDHPGLGIELFNSRVISSQQMGTGTIYIGNGNYYFIDKYYRIAIGYQPKPNIIEFNLDKKLDLTQRQDTFFPANTVGFRIDENALKAQGLTLPMANQSGFYSSWHTSSNNELLHNIELYIGKKLPIFDVEGMTCGGTLNCTGHAMSMDNFLASPKYVDPLTNTYVVPSSSALPDNFFLQNFTSKNPASSVESTLDFENTAIKIGKAGDNGIAGFKNAEEAAKYYGMNKPEEFNTMKSLFERLLDLPDNGTAIIFYRNPESRMIMDNVSKVIESPYYHAVNVKKVADGNPAWTNLYFFDAQSGLATQDMKTVLGINQYNVFTDAKVVETTQYHIKEANRVNRMPWEAVNEVSKNADIITNSKSYWLAKNKVFLNQEIDDQLIGELTDMEIIDIASFMVSGHKNIPHKMVKIIEATEDAHLLNMIFERHGNVPLIFMEYIGQNSLEKTIKEIIVSGYSVHPNLYSIASKGTLKNVAKDLAEKDIKLPSELVEKL